MEENKMINFIKRMLCKHEDLAFSYNLYGDEINIHHGKRSLWGCRKCGKSIYKDEIKILDGDQLMEVVKKICSNQQCCLDCPLYKDDCMIVRIPFNWDINAINEAIKESR
jgi:hypothetical protein